MKSSEEDRENACDPILYRWAFPKCFIIILSAYKRGAGLILNYTWHVKLWDVLLLGVRYLTKTSINGPQTIYTARPKQKLSHTCQSRWLWLRSTFAVALFRQPYAMSQHLNPVLHSFFAAILYWWQESLNIPLVLSFDPNGVNGVKVRTLWWPIENVILPDTHGSSCSTLSQLEPNESCHCCPGICPSHQGRKNPLMGSPGHSVHWGTQLACCT